MSDYVEIWERVWFSAGEAVKWERSLDKGKTWEDVNWPGDKLPFILCNAFDPSKVEYVVERRLLPA